MDEVESGKHEGGVRVHIIYAVFLYSEWYIELNEIQIQSLALVKPGGTHSNFIKEGFAPRSNPLPFHISFLAEKVAISYTFYSWYPYYFKMLHHF